MDQPTVCNPTPRQTLGYLRELFSSHRLHPKAKLGQNFLIDLNILDFLLRSAELTRNDLVLEVGTGTGGLTAKLADHTCSVLTVEIDPAFHELAQENLAHHANVTLVHADVLKNKNTLNPDVLDHLARLKETCKPERVKLIANLPYAVATPVISNLLIKGIEFERMVVTVQWEIAEKLIAQPGTKEYGALAVMIQSLADAVILRRLSPSVFWPRPKVDSGIVRITPNQHKRARIANVQRLRDFLRALYSHRRKNLRGSLISLTGSQHQKASVDAKLATLGYAGTERAEMLSIEQHLQLCEAFPTA